LLLVSAHSQAELLQDEQDIARVIDESIMAVKQAAAAIVDFRTFTAARRKRQATVNTAFCSRLQQQIAEFIALSKLIQESNGCVTTTTSTTTTTTTTKGELNCLRITKKISNFFF
jgi:hypothetical protein